MTIPAIPDGAQMTRQRAQSTTSGANISGHEQTGLKRVALAQGQDNAQAFAARREAILDLLAEHSDLVDFLVEQEASLRMIIRDKRMAGVL